MPTARGLLALALLFSAAILAGCSGDGKSRVTLLLFDDSASADSMRARYEKIARAVARDLKPGERVVVGRITGASLQDARLPVDVRVPSFNPLTQTTGSHEDAVQKARFSIKKSIKTLGRGRPSKCTDLFGAMELAEKVFRNAPADAQKRLVIVSDMIETCRANFRSHELDGEDVEGLIKELRKGGRLPALQGVRVWVAGATSTTKLPPGRVRDIEQFWLEYFKTAGAELRPGQYGPTLLGLSNGGR